MSNNELPIIRPRLAFEREYGTYRNWWVRDPRLTGNPLSILLYLLSHAEGHRVTQTEAREELGLGVSAWRAAKHRLMEAGFLVEVRDFYPSGKRRGQKRFRLVLQDPQPNTFVEITDTIIQLESPVEDLENLLTTTHSRKSTVAPKPSVENQQWVEKPQVRASVENQQWEKATVENQPSLIGRENQVRLGNGLLNNQTNQPNHRAREFETELDQELERLVPGLGLTFDAINVSVNGRVDLSTVDVVAAVRDTLLKSKHPVSRPADYVASSIVKYPSKWARNAVTPAEYVPQATAPENLVRSETHDRDECATGQHDWGPASWGLDAQGWCVRARCGVRRSSVDSAYAAWEETQGVTL